MQISRRSALLGTALLPWTIRSAAADAPSAYARATLGSASIVARGVAATQALADALARLDQLLRTLIGVTGPIAGSPFSCLVVSGAELRRFRSEAGRFTTANDGSSEVAINARREGVRYYTCNGDVLRKAEDVVTSFSYYLTESELLDAGRTAHWYRVGYCNLFSFARFRSSSQLTIGLPSPAARFTGGGGEWLALRERFSMTISAAIDRGVGAAFAGQAWYLAHYLSFANPELRPQFAAFAGRGQLESPDAVEAAWTDALPIPLATFEADLDAYRLSKIKAYTYKLAPFEAAADNPRLLTQVELDQLLGAAIDRLRESPA